MDLETKKKQISPVKENPFPLPTLTQCGRTLATCMLAVFTTSSGTK